MKTKGAKGTEFQLRPSQKKYKSLFEACQASNKHRPKNRRISYNTFVRRIHNGWSSHRAFHEPVREYTATE
jgi:hypothetical protein